MHLLTITTFFPNSADKQRAVFVYNLVQAIRKRCEVEVISPVPFAPPAAGKPHWQAQRAIPPVEDVNGIRVEHPRFFVVPKVTWPSGIGYFLGILKALLRVKRQKGRLLIHAHCAYPDAVGVALAACLLRIPYVVTAHGSDINVYAERALLRAQIRWAMRRAHGVVAVSRALECKVKNLLGDTKTKVACIPCAAYEPQVFYPREKSIARSGLMLALNARIAIFVGQLVPIKGVEFLVAAWDELHQSGKLNEADRLILIGDGPSREALVNQVRSAKLDGQVLFLGALSQAEVARYIQAANFLCLPSRNEGMPNVIVEALACGIPVVASKVGGIPELVQDGENGILVPPGDVTALARAIEAALDRKWNDENISSSVSDRTWGAIAQKNHEFFEQLLSDDHAISTRIK